MDEDLRVRYWPGGKDLHGQLVELLIADIKTDIGPNRAKINRGKGEEDDVLGVVAVYSSQEADQIVEFVDVLECPLLKLDMPVLVWLDMDGYWCTSPSPGTQSRACGKPREPVRSGQKWTREKALREPDSDTPHPIVRVQNRVLRVPTPRGAQGEVPGGRFRLGFQAIPKKRPGEPGVGIRINIQGRPGPRPHELYWPLLEPEPPSCILALVLLWDR